MLNLHSLLCYASDICEVEFAGQQDHGIVAVAISVALAVNLFLVMLTFFWLLTFFEWNYYRAAEMHHCTVTELRFKTYLPCTE